MNIDDKVIVWAIIILALMGFWFFIINTVVNNIKGAT